MNSRAMRRSRSGIFGASALAAFWASVSPALTRPPRRPPPIPPPRIPLTGSPYVGRMTRPPRFALSATAGDGRLALCGAGEQAAHEEPLQREEHDERHEDRDEGTRGEQVPVLAARARDLGQQLRHRRHP